MECPKCETVNTADSQFCKKCATSLTELSGISLSHTRTLQTPTGQLTRGTLFSGRYEVIEKLGEGGMGAVYRVEDTKVEEEVALKLINPSVASEQKTIERFRNELKYTRKIRHKNVCQMFDLGEFEGTHFITMEYVAGEDLKSLLRRTGKLTIEMGARVAKQIVEGLSEAHRLGIVHRDLKPSNIMIDNDGSARIMDFGIARSKEAKGITGAGLVIGTPEYMSPEQAEGKETDQRSDIYSLGVILYEIFTGQRPFEGDSALGVAMMHKSEVPKQPAELNSNLTEPLNRLILKCMNKGPEDRFQSAEEMSKTLALLDYRLPEIKTGTRQKSGLASKEITVSISLKKILIPVSVLLFVIVAGLFVWRPWSKDAAVDIPIGKTSLAILYFKNISGDSEVDLWKTAFPEYLMADLGQSKHFNVLDQIKIYSIIQDLDLLEAENLSEGDLIKVSEMGAASHVLTGVIRKSENLYNVNVTLYRADTLEKLGTEEVEGGLEMGMDNLVDQLTPRVKKLLGLSEAQVANDIDMNIGDIRPKSEEAYDYFAKGYRAHQMESQYAEAIELYKKALAIEPDFGFGYLCMAVSYYNQGMASEFQMYAEKALEFEGKMSVRELNYAQGMLYTYSENTFDKGFDAYKEILKYYPDDGPANAELGWGGYVLEEWDETIKYCGHIWKIGWRDSWIPFSFLSSAYCAKGMYDPAKECLEDFLENNGEHVRIRGALSLVYLSQGEFDKALVEIERSVQSNSGPRINLALGTYLYCREDFEEAGMAFEQLKQAQDSTLSLGAFVYLANTLMTQGKFEEATMQLRKGLSIAAERKNSLYITCLYLALIYNHIKTANFDVALAEFDHAWETAKQSSSFADNHMRQLMALKGVALLENGNIEEAQNVLISLNDLVESGKKPKAKRLYYHLAGLIEVHLGNDSLAIKYFNNALELTPHEYPIDIIHAMDMALYLESLGEVYFNMGDLDKAIEQFEKIQSLTIGRLSYGDIYAKSFYMLGKIFEKKGWQGKAIESYEKFLELWKDADPGFIEVADAREREAALQNNQDQ